MDEKMRQKEIERVFLWFAENPTAAEQIRCEDGIVDTGEAIALLEKLRQDRMEYLIPVLLTNVYTDRVMNKVIKCLTAEAIIKMMESEGIDAVISRLIEIAKSECDKK